jgi:hypothetical protein
MDDHWADYWGQTMGGERAPQTDAARADEWVDQ